VEPTAAATFCATLVDEWVRNGVEHAIFAPGSRSTPMVLALDADDRIQLHRFLDERSAGFAALGIGKVSGRPAVVLTTSGTAAVELHPAVVEASYDRVPLIACTADRPPELRGVGAPQTIDQQNLYGSAVRWFCDAGVPDQTEASRWRDLARSALGSALGPPAGPVQLNLPFREPLLGAAAALPPVDRDAIAPPRRDADEAAVRDVAALVHDKRGVIVAGGHLGDPGPVLALAERLGWPVLADPRSGCRVPRPGVVAHFDGLLRVEAVRSRPVDVVLRLGSLPASKVLTQWFTSLGDAAQIGVDADGWTFDPDHNLGMLVSTAPDAFCGALATEVAETTDRSWVEQWAAWDEAVARVISAALADNSSETEPNVAREVVAALPDSGVLVVSSSMPIRDVEWYSAPRHGIRVLANRGANGIDGVVSTAVGVALTGVPTTCLLGDLAFLHDQNGLSASDGQDIDLRVVVVDNDGGGIFSFLPQHSELDRDRYERLFGTPHGRAAGWLAGGEPLGIEARTTSRADNVAVHRAIHTAIAAALS
jgi:2-succinyl-5-enolpyruvyl-6-hydroxy-3-cyclohexene-1-carboxylate synthase